MVEGQSETIGRNAQLAILLEHKWKAEIERAVDKVKLGTVPGRKRTRTDGWFRRQWFRAMMRDRMKKSAAEFKAQRLSRSDFRENAWLQTDKSSTMVRRLKVK